MALVTRAIPGFYNGVNQQPPSVRLDTQVDTQVNGFSSLVDGLTKRQNTEHLAILTSAAETNAFIHTILRDETERYVVVFTDDSSEPIEVYTVEGQKCTVRYGNLTDDLTFTEDATVKNYVVTESPFKDIRATTINDYTLVCNRTKKVELTASVAPGGLAGKVQTFSKLPAGSEGQIYEVAGDNNNNFDSYYVVLTGGVWKQAAKPGVKDEINKSTMPHKLVRTSDLQFTFSPIVYDKRIVGDDLTNPVPSFVDSYVNNIFFFKGRTGFLSADRVVLSRANDFFNFWRASGIDVLADDVIDVDVSSTLPNSVVNLLEYAPFNTNLILISPGQQFSLQSSSTILSPTSVACTPVTTFEFNSWSTVCVAGTNVVFSCKSGDNVTFREYYVQPDSLLNDAADITAHVPNYIPAGNVQMEVCNALDILFAQSSGEPNAIYVYKYLWRDNEKPQSSWSKWTFDGDIIGYGVIETDLYIVIKRNNQVCLEKMQLKRVSTPGLDFRVHLDRLTSITGAYNASTKETTFTLPYTEDANVVLIDRATGQMLLNIIRVDNTHVKVRGDFSSKQYWLGIDYIFTVRFNEFFVKDINSKVPYLGGVLKLRTLSVSYAETGYFRVEVTPKARQTLRQDFTGVVIGSSRIGSPHISTGSKRFTIFADSHNTTVEIINDTYLPCAFQAGAMEAIWSMRSKIV